MTDRGVTRVFVLDDHEVVRDGVRALVDAEPDMHVVGDADRCAVTIERVRRSRPDVALVDLRPGDCAGTELCRRLLAEFDELKCIIWTSLRSDHVLVEAAAAGASAVVLKEFTNDEIVASIRAVADGRQLLDAAAVRLAERRIRDSDEGHIRALTPQERRIFGFIGEGLTNGEIAAEMGLSPPTVKNYVSNLLTKLGLHRRAEVAALAGRAAVHGTP